jgi:hypothetical protein
MALSKRKDLPVDIWHIIFNMNHQFWGRVDTCGCWGCPSPCPGDSYAFLDDPEDYPKYNHGRKKDASRWPPESDYEPCWNNPCSLEQEIGDQTFHTSIFKVKEPRSGLGLTKRQKLALSIIINVNRQWLHEGLSLMWKECELRTLVHHLHDNPVNVSLQCFISSGNTDLHHSSMNAGHCTQITLELFMSHNSWLLGNFDSFVLLSSTVKLHFSHHLNLSLCPRNLYIVTAQQ